MDKKMKKENKKIITILTLISLFTCAFPGCFLLFSGTSKFIIALEQYVLGTPIMGILRFDLIWGLIQVCLSGLLCLVPMGLGVVLLVEKNKPKELSKLEPTGLSSDEPLPPPS